MTELSTTLGLEDLHDVLEVLAVDDHNRRIVQKHIESKQRD